MFHIARVPGPGVRPRRVLDFECGVGRVLIPLARRCPPRLGWMCPTPCSARPRPIAARAGTDNVVLVEGDDDLSQGHRLLRPGSHVYRSSAHRSSAVRIFRRLVDLIARLVDGAAASSYAVPPPPPTLQTRRGLLRSVALTVLAPFRRPAPAQSRPGEMQMNVYPLNLLRAFRPRACGGFTSRGQRSGRPVGYSSSSAGRVRSRDRCHVRPASFTEHIRQADAAGDGVQRQVEEAVGAQFLGHRLLLRHRDDLPLP